MTTEDLSGLLADLEDRMDTTYSEFVCKADVPDVDRVLRTIEDRVRRWRAWERLPDRRVVDDLDADALQHLASIKRDRERREAEQRVARAAGLVDGPTIGAYRRQQGGIELEP